MGAYIASEVVCAIWFGKASWCLQSPLVTLVWSLQTLQSNVSTMVTHALGVLTLPLIEVWSFDAVQAVEAATFGSLQHVPSKVL